MSPSSGLLVVCDGDDHTLRVSPWEGSAGGVGGQCRHRIPSSTQILLQHVVQHVLDPCDPPTPSSEASSSITPMLSTAVSKRPVVLPGPHEVLDGGDAVPAQDRWFDHHWFWLGFRDAELERRYVWWHNRQCVTVCVVFVLPHTLLYVCHTSVCVPLLCFCAHTRGLRLAAAACTRTTTTGRQRAVLDGLSRACALADRGALCACQLQPQCLCTCLSYRPWGLHPSPVCGVNVEVNVEVNAHVLLRQMEFPNAAWTQQIQITLLHPIR